MSYGRSYTAGIEDDRDRLQELKGTLMHWMTIARKYAEETRDPYAFVEYMNVEHQLRACADTVDRTIGLVLEEKSAELAERMSKLHREICQKSTIFGSPC